MIVTINGVRVHTPKCPKCGAETAPFEDDDGFLYHCLMCGYDLTFDDVLAYEKKVSE